MLVPLWDFVVEDVRAQISALANAVELLRIEDCAEYLGVYLGPGAHRFHGILAAAKFLKRVRALRNCNLGLGQTVLAYHERCLSVFGHLLQFITPPRAWTTLEARCLQILAVSPRHSLTSVLLQQLRDLGLSLGG